MKKFWLYTVDAWDLESKLIYYMFLCSNFLKLFPRLSHSCRCVVRFICCRHGNEEKLVTTFGVMQALVSFIAHSEEPDTLKCITSDDRKFVFLIKEHLILVAVSRSAH